MLIFGITGPSGAGKGVVSDILASHGVKIIDADKVYHKIITPPSKCLDELVSFFGDGIIDANGSLDRAALSNLVFGGENADKLEMLNKITHKYVAEDILGTVAALEANGERFCAIDAPLLIEARLNERCDAVIAVIAPKEIRAERISQRDSIDIERAYARINSQKSAEYYISYADYVVNNDGDIAGVRAAVEEILTERKVINK